MAGHHREVSVLSKNRCLLDGSMCLVLLAVIWFGLLRPVDQDVTQEAVSPTISSYQAPPDKPVAKSSRPSFSASQTTVQEPPVLAVGAEVAPPAEMVKSPAEVAAAPRVAVPPLSPQSAAGQRPVTTSTAAMPTAGSIPPPSAVEVVTTAPSPKPPPLCVPGLVDPLTGLLGQLTG